MGGPFFFLTFSGHPSDADYRRMQAVAQRHDASCTLYTGPTERPRGWFQCHNRGAPFDGATARAVQSDLEREGLWPITPKPACDGPWTDENGDWIE